MRRQHLVWHTVVGVEDDETVDDGRHISHRRLVLRCEGLVDAQLAWSGLGLGLGLGLGQG